MKEPEPRKPKARSGREDEAEAEEAGLGFEGE